NASFVAKLENAIPGATAFLGATAPAIPPYFPVNDGTLVLDAFNSYLLLGGIPADANGEISVSIPIPNVTGLTVNMQWILIAPTLPFPLAVSKALQFTL